MQSIAPIHEWEHRSVKTKVMCTIGPKSNSVAAIVDLIRNGMSLARLNMVHGSIKDNENIIKNIRQAEKETGKIVGILADLKGPQIRTGNLKNGLKSVMLVANQKFKFYTNFTHGDNTHITINYWDLPKYVKPGDKLITDYGRIEFVIEKVSSKSIETVVMNDGVLCPNKVVTIVGTPDRDITFPSLSFQDTVDVDFAVRHQIDFISARLTGAQDIDDIRSLPGIMDAGIKLLVKIENRRGIDNLQEILHHADGIIITRSDIAVETPLEYIAPLQKLIARESCLKGKPIYVQNQILNSMVENPRPTRAECTDIANAVLECIDGVVLTNCTAIGLFPADSVKIALSQCLDVEENAHYKMMFDELRDQLDEQKDKSISESICSSAVKTAWDVAATCIVAITKTGETAGRIAKYQPHIPVICVTTERSARYVLLYRGTVPVIVDSTDPKVNSREKLLEIGIQAAKDMGLLKEDENLVAVTGGGFLTQHTNMYEVIRTNEHN